MDDTFTVTPAGARGKAVVVRVSGRVDAKTSSQLVERCLAPTSPGAHLVLNLAEVTFLSSSGVGALMVLSERLAAQGGSLRLVALSSAASGPLRLLNLDRFLQIDESEDAALGALGS
jgi:anti-anti-sigma factor